MTEFWTTPELAQIHIELTNACNAACPMCVRFYRNSPLPRPDLEIGQITLEQFKTYFPPSILQPLKKIMFCGTQGDPGMARDTLEICEYLMKNTSETFLVQMHTNGGMRTPDWWAKLGALFSQRSPRNLSCWRVIFSIDGLEDTNHIYRRNVKWDNLMANAKAFIDAGGNAVWEYLIFEHNEHQIETARKMADDLGFVLFVPKAALGVDNGTQLTTMNALDKDGKLDYVINAPKNPANRNLSNPTATHITKSFTFKFEDYRELKKNKSNENYKEKVNRVYEIINREDTSKFDSCEIKCKAKTKNEWGTEIFVDNFGRVLPCCYVGTHISGTFPDYQSLQLHKHMNDYGWDNFDLNRHSLREILDAGHLNRVFADSWSKDSVKAGKMAYCSSICGEESRIDRVYFEEVDPSQIAQK